METPETLSTFTVDDDFMNQWFDSFHPSIRTFAADFVINKLRRYDFNPDMVEEEGDRYFAHLLGRHFDAFLRMKMMEANPGHLVMGYSLLG